MKNDIDLDVLLKEMATQHQPRLPSAGLIWWRAQVTRKLRAKERVERPLLVMRRMAMLTCVLALVGLVASNWGQLQAALRSNNWLFVPLFALMATTSLVTVVLLRFSLAKV
jgi:hypothetical protein